MLARLVRWILTPLVVVVLLPLLMVSAIGLADMPSERPEGTIPFVVVLWALWIAAVWIVRIARRRTST